ncbi:MAG: hypothetical protein SF051_10525, partial [Elusimicrobiota bacterium]|nr:hypothetical protein [Elusimicrobiota bacterium]
PAASASIAAARLAPAGDRVAANDGQGAPPAPPSAPATPSEEGPQKGGFGLGKAALAFIGALLVAQVGVEAMGNAMPVLAQQVFGDFTVVAQLAIFSSIASILGRQFGPLIIERFGLRNTYLFTEVARLVSISTLLGLLVMGHMTIPMMMVFYSLNGLLGGVALTAETSIPPALVGQDQAKLEKFWTWEQTLLEIIGVLGPIVAGLAVDAYGPGNVIIAFPVAFATAFMILFFTLRMPQRIEQLRVAEAAKKKAEREAQRAAGAKVDGVLGAFFKKIARGAKLVWNTPLLRYAFLAYTAYMLLNPFLYGMIGPAYGRFIAGPEAMGGVFGMLAGLYSAGGLLGGVIMIREQSRIKKLKESGAMDDAGETEHLRKSMLKWMMWTIPTLAAFATMAFHLPTLGAWMTLPAFLASTLGPLTLPALALIPFGVAQVISMVKIRSYFQAKVPNATDMADAMGFLGSASLAASTVGILALKYLFQHTAGTMPFIVIAAAMIPIGLFYFYITRKLGKVGAPADPAS